MRIESTDFAGLVVVHAPRFQDQRGAFFELYHAERYAEAGIVEEFVQDNVSTSTQRTLRGLHYQTENPQAKLITVLSGTIFDVAVDLRQNSSTFGRHFSRRLSARASADEFEQIKIPIGFAHGFCVLSATASIHYKCSDVYTPSAERTIAWNDAQLNISWPVRDPTVSAKDKLGVAFGDAPYFE